MNQHADLVLVGRIATLQGDAGFGWVEAIAVAGGRVLATGSARDIDALAGPRTRRVELSPSEIAVPGLSDAHLHLAEAGLSEDRLDLSDSPTIEDAVRRVAATHASLAGDRWLEGHGWTADRWGRWPVADELDRAAPGRRIAIWAHDHHAMWVSNAALRSAGIAAGTADPPGGIIRRRDDGTPTGVVHETATRLVTSAIPAPTPTALEAAIPAVARKLVALGVVAVHDPGALSLQAGLGPAFEAYRRLADSGTLPIRVHASVRHEQLDAALEAGIRSGDPIGDARGGIRVGWLKLFADGTLASRTAALLEPLEREPDRPVAEGAERGMFTTPPAVLTSLAARAASGGIACQIHGIGDAAVRAALDALAPTVGASRLQQRIEHVQLVAAEDIARFASSRVAASVQPVHLRADAAAARRLWGRRAEAFGYPWRSLLASGAVVAFGTDAPVESIDPWPGLAMAISRRDPGWPDDAAVFGPAERVTPAEALRAACVGPATVAGEDDRGRLVAGNRADVVVIPASAFAEPVEPDGPLGATRPRLVLVGGETAFEA